MVDFRSVFQTELHVFFVMEFVNGGSLYELITSKRANAENVKFYGSEILSAIEYLHSLDIMHG